MRASKAADKVGVVVHGPEVIDSGNALLVLDLLERLGPVRAVLGGTMGRVAVIDAFLENRIDITQRELPSKSVQRLQKSADVIVILNEAKCRDTGLAFGRAVTLRANPDKPLIMADFGGGFVAILAGESSCAFHLALLLSQDLKLEITTLPHEPPNAIISETIPFDESVKRVLVGTILGENISFNGTVIARASSSSVEIKAKNGQIVEIKGAVPKLHGLEKLPKRIDIETAILRSGDIRRTEREVRSLKWTGQMATLIDHAAESTFEKAKGAGVVITVGDDTTAIAGDVLARLGIPLIGIVDGDLDNLSHKTSKPPESIIITVQPGRDDVVGRRIKETIFKGENQIALNSHGVEGLVSRVKEVVGNDLISIKKL